MLGKKILSFHGKFCYEQLYPTVWEWKGRTQLCKEVFATFQTTKGSDQRYSPRKELSTQNHCTQYLYMTRRFMKCKIQDFFFCWTTFSAQSHSVFLEKNNWRASELILDIDFFSSSIPDNLCILLHLKHEKSIACICSPVMFPIGLRDLQTIHCFIQCSYMQHISKGAQMTIPVKFASYLCFRYGYPNPCSAQGQVGRARSNLV